MANQQENFERPNAATEAAQFAANHGGEVIHEGVLFSVTYDDARTVPAAGDPTPGGYPAGFPAPAQPGYPVNGGIVTNQPGYPANNPNGTVSDAIAAAKSKR